MVRVQLYTYSTCTTYSERSVQLFYLRRYLRRYFRTTYFRTKVRKYFRTFVLSYFRTTLYPRRYEGTFGTSVVRKYFRIIRKYFRTFVRKYFRTKVQLQLRVHVRCLIKVVGPNGLTVLYTYTCRAMCTVSVVKDRLILLQP